jgi:hypothetical protein
MWGLADNLRIALENASGNRIMGAQRGNEEDAVRSEKKLMAFLGTERERAWRAARNRAEYCRAVSVQTLLNMLTTPGLTEDDRIAARNELSRRGL